MPTTRAHATALVGFFNLTLLKADWLQATEANITDKERTWYSTRQVHTDAAERRGLE